ncbi:MAG: hypothetical protein WC924_00085 [Candidatus Gracilibacteria bacterium]
MSTHAASISDAASCPDDYYGFILTVRSENTRNQTIKDAFTMGYCQLFDIMALDDELDNLREGFRAAAFECADTTSYKKEYVRILLEQYFVRNIQKNSSDVIDVDEAAEYDALKEARLTKLKKDMSQLFVVEENRVSESTLNDYFENWASKYDDRIGDYSKCEEGAWTELTVTWNDFVETIKELSVDIDTSHTISFKDNISVDNDLGAGVKKFRDTGRSILDGYEYYKNLMGLGEAEVEAPVDVSDLSGSDETYTFGTILEVLEEDVTRATIEAESVDRMAKYKILYGEGGAVAATDMQSILEYLNQIISESNTKDFPTIITGVSKIYDKQCN